MSEIRFYIPEGETIPTDLQVYVDDVYVGYERIKGGFRFRTLLDDDDRALEIVGEIAQTMIREHNESEHGVSWRTVSLEVVPQEERYKLGTVIDWKYRVRDWY